MSRLVGAGRSQRPFQSHRANGPPPVLAGPTTFAGSQDFSFSSPLRLPLPPTHLRDGRRGGKTTTSSGLSGPSRRRDRASADGVQFPCPSALAGGTHALPRMCVQASPSMNLVDRLLSTEVSGEATRIGAVTAASTGSVWERREGLASVNAFHPPPLTCFSPSLLGPRRPTDP